ncbi:tyrosine-type recombinase/integrase [Micromonospora wenchangensis]|uniref:tyrosine-type recombinase/integrase n=1 Tax=Micromonospora wenchangensis TaxID=1185415 RepID=UPI003D741372
MSCAQAEALLAAADTGSQAARTAAIVALLLYTGLRVGELVGTDVEQLDHDRNRSNICASTVLTVEWRIIIRWDSAGNSPAGTAVVERTVDTRPSYATWPREPPPTCTRLPSPIAASASWSATSRRTAAPGTPTPEGRPHGRSETGGRAAAAATWCCGAAAARTCWRTRRWAATATRRGGPRLRDPPRLVRLADQLVGSSRQRFTERSGGRQLGPPPCQRPVQRPQLSGDPSRPRLPAHLDADKTQFGSPHRIRMSSVG